MESLGPKLPAVRSIAWLGLRSDFMVRFHYTRRGADAVTELLLAQLAIRKCGRTPMQLRPIKREISGNMIWPLLLAFDASVVAVMNEFAWWRREHASHD
jgi:hypothetical protein